MKSIDDSSYRIFLYFNSNQKGLKKSKTFHFLCEGMYVLLCTHL